MKLFICIILLVFIISCGSEPDSPDVLMRTDSAFSQMAKDSGMHKAFSYYAAHEILRFSFEKLIENDSVKIDSARLSSSLLQWQPLKANVSKTGDLGWTSGNWFYLIKTVKGYDTVKTGTYVTFWEKQEDGSWKYIIDNGNLSPDDFK